MTPPQYLGFCVGFFTISEMCFPFFHVSNSIFLLPHLVAQHSLKCRHTHPNLKENESFVSQSLTRKQGPSTIVKNQLCWGYKLILYKQWWAFSPVINEMPLATFITLLHSYILLDILLGLLLTFHCYEWNMESSMFAQSRRIVQKCTLDRQMVPRPSPPLWATGVTSVTGGRSHLLSPGTRTWRDC